MTPESPGTGAPETPHAPGWRGHWRAWRQRLRIALATLRHPGIVRAQRRHFTREPWRTLCARHPELHRKLFQPYPIAGLSVPERWRWMQAHERWMRQLFTDAAQRQILLDGGTVACRVALPDGHGAPTIQLRYAHHYLQEGELSLVLHDPFGTPLYALTFLFVDEPDGRQGVLVGALQGQLSTELDAHLTHLALGVRPPTLLLFTLQCLAEGLGAVRLRAAGRTRHAYAGRRLARRIRFDYDAFWQASGGSLAEDGLWTLPLHPPRRAAGDIPARKRAHYRRRYAWLDTLRADIAARLVPSRRDSC